MRSCRHCGGSMEGKRPHAIYCSRTCKNAAFQRRETADPELRARRIAGDRARYAREAKRRRAYARADYERNAERYREYSRQYRRENPHRRRAANDARAERMRGNPGFCPFSHDEWIKLLRRHSFRCAYCGRADVRLEQDHVVPLSRGGRHAIANILPACPDCNRSKGGRLLSEWRLANEGG